jgi:non-ribosomal peptide synthetase component F
VRLAAASRPSAATPEPVGKDDHRALWLQQIFETRVDASPDSIALICGDIEMTYRELDVAANRLAQFLRRQGIFFGARVGVLLHRSVDTYVSLLAILKVGATFVPLDPTFPAERDAYIARDAALTTVITSAGLRDKLAEANCRLLLLDKVTDEIASCSSARLPLPYAKDDGAIGYIIYTSGSTGKPKGVAITHPPNTIPECTNTGGCPDNGVILVDREGQVIWQYGQFQVGGSGPNELNTPVRPRIYPTATC